MAKIYRTLCILLLVSPLAVTAQPYSFRFLTVNDGLPSNETYAVYQKETGELVIGTEYGLVIYDGEDFKQVPFEENRFNGSIVLGLKPDKRNRIWIKTYRDGFFYLENDTLRSFVGNDLVTDKTHESTVDRFYVDADMNIWFTIGNNYDSVYKINTRGNKVEAINKTISAAGINQFVHRVDTNTFLVVKTKNTSQNMQASWKVIENNGSIAIIPPTEYWKLNQVRTGAFINRANNFWLSMGNVLLHWDRKAKIMHTYPFESEIYSLEEDNQENILIGTRKGAFIFQKKHNSIKNLFNNRIVHAIFQDNEQGYWFATNNGIVYMPSLDILLVDNKNFTGVNISAIAGNEKFMGAAGTDRFVRLFAVKDNEMQFSGQYYRNIDITIPKKIIFSEDKLIYGTSFLNLNDLQEYTITPSPKGEILDIEPGEIKNTVLFAYKRGYSVYGNPLQKPTEVYSQRLFCRAVCQKNNKIYIGSDKGLYVNSATGEQTRLYPDLLKYSVNDIKSTTRGEIIVATRAGGVFVLTADSIYQITTTQGLSSPLCSKILVQNDSTFWVGTNKGLNRVYWHTGSIRIDNWYTEDGLISDKINDLAQTGSFLVVLTDLGINYFETNTIAVSQPKLKIRLDEIRINGRLASTQEVLTLEPGERDIWFDFKVLGFKKRNNIQMVYVLRGKDKLLSQTGGRTIMYRDLSPGKYTLEVLVLGANGMPVGNPLNYTINIEPHFYETIFFKVIIIALLLAIIASGVIVYLKRLEAGRRRKWEYSNAQLEALNMQINPHFLFNSLNNIQYLSFSKEHKVLNRFISGLSELLRGILKNSKTNLIPLRDELKNIEHYLELEVMRFEDETFSYKIIVDETLALDREYIPPMLVQPLVENAIWHGLLTKKGSKFLEIHWAKIPKGFRIEVLDNGIGINQAMANKKNTNDLKPSLGLENVKRRLELYESMEYGKATLEIEDLTGKPPYFEGTRATMEFEFSSVKNKKHEAKIGNSG